MAYLLLLLTLLGYSASAINTLRALANSRVDDSKLASITAIVGFAAHAALLYWHLQRDQFDHLNVAISLSVVAWLLAGLTLIRGHRHSGLLLRPVIYLFAALSAILVVFTPVSWGANIASVHGLVIHIVLSLLAYGVLALATLYAVQLNYLNKVLKQRKSTAIANYLPPLLTVERYFFRLLSAGTGLLALAIISGFVFLDDLFAQGQAHKTILSLIAFATYAGIVLLHKFSGARGRVVVSGTVIAGLILTLAYFGSRFVKDVILG
ncbi:ABC transporter permease [Idiomarina tyrosinivorans]|uniref:ABC transporter permease n=1 Tax=Idiomarina tyrosinivorans TaxID=1445662 RepID=A0A432ZLL5_9GAMM|nr:cytochrome c biogenesis protein CcsA [Idiomarina tyrosinivorans]RUO78866.1 ABC transporter permease [Idiomarina tyrosinivorans]